MFISVQILLIIGSGILVLPAIISAARPKQKHSVCRPFPHISLEHGKITAIGTQKYLFKCDPGYFLASPPQVRCWKGKWSSTKEPKCLKAEGQCEDPDPLTAGEILGDERHEGSTIQYMCKPGFILMGEGMRTCLSGGHWSGITPVCMDESEPIQKVAERFKEKFVTNVGSHSSDITWGNSRGTKAPCSASKEEDGLPRQSSTTAFPDDDVNGSRDLTENDDDLSAISISFPSVNPLWLRKHKRRHKNKRGKLAFEPSLSSIAEDVEGETAEEVFSGDSGSGDDAILLLENFPCYETSSSELQKNNRGNDKKEETPPLIKPMSTRHKGRERKRNRNLSKNYQSRSKTYRASKYGSNMRGKGTGRRLNRGKQRRIMVEAERKLK